MSRSFARRRQRAALLVLAALSVWGVGHALHALAHVLPSEDAVHGHTCAHHPAHADAKVPDPAPGTPVGTEEECAVCDTELGPLHGDLLPLLRALRPELHPTPQGLARTILARPQAPSPARGPPVRC